MIKMFDDNQKTVGVFCVISFLLFALIAIFHVVMFFLARREYRKAGGLAAAKTEASGVAIRGNYN
jgi:hypothetical protein